MERKGLLCLFVFLCSLFRVLGFTSFTLTFTVDKKYHFVCMPPSLQGSESASGHRP